MKFFVTLLLITFLFIGCYSHKQTIHFEKPFVFPYPQQQKTWKLPFNPEKIIPLISITAVGDIINLESPFTRTGTKFEKKFTFKVSPAHAAGLANAGFDVVNLANNHILDYGIEGLNNTLTILDSIGLAHCGAGLTLEQAQMPAILKRNGLRIAVLGYSMTFPEEFWATDSTGGTNYPNKLKANVEHSDSIADFTIVTFHWGAEGMNHPKDYQKHFAHLAIDAGADLVLGHHPHVLQGLEIYKNQLIAYSLGNFSFSSYSKTAVESMILKVYLTDNGLLFAKVIPISVNNIDIAFQPRILKGAAADTVISHLRKYSESLNSTSIIDNDGYIWGMKFIAPVELAQQAVDGKRETVDVKRKGHF